MLKRALLGLLIVWCCWGAWRLLAGEPTLPESTLPESTLPEFGTDVDPLDKAAPAEPVGLEAHGERPSAPDLRRAAKGHAGRSVPEWLQGLAGVTEAGDRERFIAWLKGDPRRILDLLFRQQEWHVAGKSPAEEIYRDAAETLGGDTASLGFLVPTLLAELEASKANWQRMSALLGALSRMTPALDESARTAVILLAARQDLNKEVRVLAVLAGLNYPGLEAKKVAAMAQGVGAAGAVHQQTQMHLLERLEAMGPKARVFLPSLLALHESVIRSWWVHEPVLRVLQAVAPDDERVFAALVRALGSNGTHQHYARQVLLADGVEGRRRLIAFLSTAGSAARVNGVALLLEEGVPGQEVGHLLLPALTNDSARFRRRAVALLPRTGLASGAVLPSIEALFATKSPAKWITATEALGALSRMPGDRGPVVDLLFTAVRMPEVRVRVVAVQTLLMYDGENKRVVPLLADLLEDSEAAVRREAVDGLGELSAHDAVARGHLQAALGDSDETVREVARYWLEEDSEDGDEADGEEDSDDD